MNLDNDKLLKIFKKKMKKFKAYKRFLEIVASNKKVRVK